VSESAKSERAASRDSSKFISDKTQSSTCRHAAHEHPGEQLSKKMSQSCMFSYCSEQEVCGHARSAHHAVSMTRRGQTHSLSAGYGNRPIANSTMVSPKLQTCASETPRVRRRRVEEERGSVCVCVCVCVCVSVCTCVWKVQVQQEGVASTIPHTMRSNRVSAQRRDYARDEDVCNNCALAHSHLLEPCRVFLQLAQGPCTRWFRRMLPSSTAEAACSHQSHRA
jgi:hypothetical protein